MCSYKDSALEVKQSPFAGRTYRTARALEKGTCVLDIATPYADVIYKQFRTEVCAECWKYDGGRRTFLTARNLGESAGLLFCNDQCKARWLGREGEELVALLAELEAARQRKHKGKEKQTEPEGTPRPEDIGQYIINSWEVVRRESTRAKLTRQWKTIQLDDFQADMARYVLIALYHYARELDSQSSDAPGPRQSSSHLQFGMATWDDFSALQSGELQQVTKFPELVSDHIRIYKVLYSRFGTLLSPESTTSTRNLLHKLITIENVRKALSVDPGNSFGIWEVPVAEESEALGFGLYPIPSFFNHNCSPNMRKEHDGRRLRFVTARDIAAGEELCISYGLMETLGLEQRKKELMGGWFFCCQCSRCVTEEGAARASS